MNVCLIYICVCVCARVRACVFVCVFVCVLRFYRLLFSVDCQFLNLSLIFKLLCVSISDLKSYVVFLKPCGFLLSEYLHTSILLSYMSVSSFNFQFILQL